MLFRSSTPNGNSLVWQFLNNIINELTIILKELLQFFTYRGLTNTKIKVNFNLKMLRALTTNLKIYPNQEEKLKERLKELL